MLELLEAMMLFCFGFAWPFNIYKSYKARSNKGKSLLFLLVILFGYMFGIAFKIFSPDTDFVLWLYLLNSIFVFIDIMLYVRNMRLDNHSDNDKTI